VSERIVARLARPLVDVDELDRIKAEHGDGLALWQHGSAFYVIRPAAFPERECWCHGCTAVVNEALDEFREDPWEGFLGAGMVVCPDCGNKRCPHATHHLHRCTGSNAPGQAGSVYGTMRVQQKRTKGWRKPEGVASVGRGSRLGVGNPYRVAVGEADGVVGWIVEDITGREVYCTPRTQDEARAVAVELYRERVVGSWRPDKRRAVIDALRGKDLMCWCPIGSPCHADVLLRLAAGEEP
jgi:hypothetical protein